MRKFIVFFFKILILQGSITQSQNTNEFKIFIDDFPERILPFTTSFDYEKASILSTPLKFQ